MILGVFGLAPSLPRVSVCECVDNFAVFFGLFFCSIKKDCYKWSFYLFICCKEFYGLNGSYIGLETGILYLFILCCQTDITVHFHIRFTV